MAAHYDLPVSWDDPIFVPYDWGYFAFVYDKTKVKDVPSDFASLAASNLKIVIEDPALKKAYDEANKAPAK